MARRQVVQSGVVQSEVYEQGGVAAMEEDSVEEQSNGVNSKVPAWFPSELPEEDELIALAQKIREMSDMPPRGAYLFIKSVRQAQYHGDLFRHAQEKVVRTWDYMHGRQTSGMLTGSKKRSVKSRAAKFYEALSEGALKRHCAMHELDYDTLASEGRVIEKLIEAAATLV